MHANAINPVLLVVDHCMINLAGRRVGPRLRLGAIPDITYASPASRCHDVIRVWGRRLHPPCLRPRPRPNIARTSSSRRHRFLVRALWQMMGLYGRRVHSGNVRQASAARGM